MDSRRDMRTSIEDAGEGENERFLLFVAVAVAVAALRVGSFRAE